MMTETLSPTTSTQPPTSNPNYTQVSCDWLEEVNYYQVSLF